MGCGHVKHNLDDKHQVISLYELNQFIKSIRYCDRNLDINGDGVIDVILFNKPFFSFDSFGCNNENLKYYGDTMYFFQKINDNAYKMVFSGYKFSEDGGFQTQDIRGTNDSGCLFYIYSVYPNCNFTAKHFIKFKENNWILGFTEYQFLDKKPNLNSYTKYTCRVYQNVNLLKLTNDSNSIKYNYIPDEFTRSKVCDSTIIEIE